MQEISSDKDEIWLEIPNFPNYYISNYGRLRTLTPRNRNSKAPEYPRYLKTRIGRGGYLTVALRSLPNKRISKTLYIHSLVLTTFFGPRPVGYHCCHKDGIKTNNHISNLRWDTPSGNVRDQIKHGVFPGLKNKGEFHCHSKLSNQQVLDIKKRVKAGESCKAIAKEYGVHRTTISAIKHRYNHK